MKSITVFECQQAGIEKREGESHRAFIAFRGYLAMPAFGRAIDERFANVGFRLSSVRGWAVEHEWETRAAAFDTYQAQSGVDRLCNAAEGIVVKVLLEALEDAQVIRDRLMAFFNGIKPVKPEQVSSLISARIGVDVWRTEILKTLNMLAAARGKDAADAKTYQRVSEAFAKAAAEMDATPNMPNLSRRRGDMTDRQKAGFEL